MLSVALLLLFAAGSCVKCEQLTQPASVTVQPGQRLTITCQVSYSLSSYWTAWIRQPAGKGLEWIGMKYTGDSYYKDSLKNKFSIDLDTSSKIVTLNGQNMQPEDAAVYYYSSNCDYWFFDYWGKGTMVTVSSGASTGPTVFPLIPCGSGSGGMVTLGCLATGFSPPALTFSWNRNGTALTDFIQYPAVQKGSSYMGVSQIQVRSEDWNSRNTFQCVATHAVMTGQGHMKKKPVVYEKPTLKVCSSSDEGTEVSFSCFAKDFAPKDHSMKWLKNDAEITSKIDEIKVVSGGRKDSNGTTVYSATSFLTVQYSEWADGVTFKCVFEGKEENGSSFSQSSSVTNKESCPGREGCPASDVEIDITGPAMQDLFLTRKGTVTCRVKVKKGLTEKIGWEDKDGNDMVSSTPPTKTSQDTWILPLDITYDEWNKGIKRFCVVEHKDWVAPLKKLYEKNIGGDTRRPSVFMLPPIEHTRKDEVTLTCFVKDFFPEEVFVSWLVDDEAADSTYNTTNPVESNGSYSAYGHLSVSLEQWRRTDVVYSCVVYHESMANTTKAIVRSIGYRTFEKTNLVNLNMNIPETCKTQ
ncbi:immunoglobulin gamma-1 heavy chain isoform X2 [Brachyistius frenatus]|uniref:immunoglobulin gamma-1 heavy chain isoform X2 n=1 Tax=Brachyistius frenatus TaxID=100188 RepID=UPI0037E750F1